MTVILLSGMTYAQETPAKDSPKKQSLKTGKKDGSGWIFEGFAKFGYRLRYTSEYTDATEEDQDIKGIFSITLKDREKKPRYSLNLLGSLSADIDGSPSGDAGPYKDAYSSYKNHFNTMIYSAYIEASMSKSKFYIGRQSVYRGESLDFDGLRTEYRINRNLNLSIYGGMPSNLWESSHEGDHFAGGGLELGASKIYSLRTDFIHIRDKKTYEPGKPAVKDNLFIVTGKYMRFKPLDFYCLYSKVNGDERRALFRTKWIDKKKRILISASILRQNVTLTDYSTELSPYAFVLAEYAPFYRYKLMLLKGFGRFFEIESGTDIRRLINNSDEGMLNHSYERYYAGIHVKKQPFRIVNFSLIAEKWHSLDGNDIVAIESLIKLSLSENLKLRTGSDFSKYKYDYSFEEERENVYTFFSRIDYKLSKASSVRFKYSFNRDEREDYHLFELYMIFNW